MWCIQYEFTRRTSQPVSAMSIGRNYALDSSPAFERRLRVRQRLNDLAYLDIGVDNGGIVLNLTDEGMGFQAVAPLGDQKEVHLRIQLPRSRTRIETTAQIIWQGPEDRQAGVRFLHMPADARGQIRQWVNSLLPPDAPLGDAAERTHASGNSIPKHEPPRPPRQDKWLTLLAESELQKQHIGNPPPIETDAGPVQGDPTRPEDPFPLEPEHHASPDSAPQNVVKHADHLEKTPSHQPANKLDSHVYQFRLNVHPNEEGGAAAGAASGFHNPGGADFIDWPIRTPQNVPLAPHTGAQDNPLPSEQSARLPVSTGISNPSLKAGRADTKPIPFTPATNTSARKWVAAVVLFLGISALCFGIGTWIGHRGSHSQIAQLPTEPAAAGPVAQPVPDIADHSSNNTRLTVNQRGVLTENTRTRKLPERRQPEKAAGTNSSRFESASKATPAKENSPLPTAGKPPEIRATPTPAPVIAESANPTSIVPRIIAGRKLRPTDRYNSCYLTYRVEPEYPLAAKQQQIEGVVKIHQVIKVDGSVQSVTLLSGPPLLAPAALEAAKYWRYFPALLNGQPVEAELDVEVDFRLPH